jgi:hypothetical protein
MAHNFHDINGLLIVGIDNHLGLMPNLIPPCMPPVIPEVPYWELVYAHPYFLGPNQQPTVKFNGVNSVVHMHSPLILWEHFPIAPMPPNLIYVLDMIFGNHLAWLPRTAVKICGTSAAVCVVGGPVSIDMDCCEAGYLPTSAVINPGTVQTTPTVMDFVVGAASVVANVAASKLTGKLGDKLFKSKFGTVLTRKLLRGKVTSRATNQAALRLGQGAGLSGKAANKAGQQMIGDFLDRALGKNPVDVGSKALGALGLDPAGLARTGLTGDDFGGVTPLGDLPKNIVTGALPPAGAVDATIQSIG